MPRLASRSSSRHSIQDPGLEETSIRAGVDDSMIGSSVMPTQVPASVSSSRHSSQEFAQQASSSATDSMIPAVRPASRSSSRHSLQLSSQQESTSTAADVRPGLPPEETSMRRTASKLDQLLPDPMLHASPSQSVQQMARQKRSMPLIQQPVRPASPSSASRGTPKSHQGFRPQQGWVGSGSKKPAKK